MKKIINRILAVLCVSVLLLSVIGCSESNQNMSGSDETQNINSAGADCIINGRSFSFVGDEAKKEWKQPLAKLLSNIIVPYGENGDILGYEVTTDPHAPAIPQCYRCGLLDVNEDGVPELLVHPYGYGGSSGNATYFVYNIFTGQKLGEIDGGNGQSWCYYYDTEYDDFDLIGQYWLRGGWEWRDRYITEVFYQESIMECMESQLFHTAHEIAGEQTDIQDENPDDIFYTATWNEWYPSTEYYVSGQAACLDDYYAAYENFVTTHVRISETELILFTWGDVSNDDDDYITKGEKMAEALISSEQKFIKP